MMLESGDKVAVRGALTQLRVDWRDVIVSGEYEINGDNWVRVHDYEHPIEA